MKDKILTEIFKNVWNHYKEKVSYVSIVENSIFNLNDTWSEDHIAFRTFPGKHCGSHILEELFTSLGFTKRDHYKFQDKKLKAFWLEPPENKENLSAHVSPKIFVSELEIEHFSPAFQKTIKKYTDNIAASPLEFIKQLLKSKEEQEETNPKLVTAVSTFLTHGPLWQRPTYSDYELLLKESEYAAWTLVFGNIANHFTVSVHLMKNFQTLADLNRFIEEELKLQLNTSGGKIKGSKNVLLEQSSTLAATNTIQFQDRVEQLPYAFIEFAYRYPLNENHEKRELCWKDYYQGFVTNNADKIFESTNRR